MKPFGSPARFDMSAQSRHNFDPSLPNGQPSPRSTTIGLRGKLILCFFILLTVAIGSSSWCFVDQSRDQLHSVTGEQARLLAYSLAKAAQPALQRHQYNDLRTIGKDLLQTNNILYVAFLDSNLKPIALANRYADFSWSHVTRIDPKSTQASQSITRQSQAFGLYIDASAPVLYKARDGKVAKLGFVAVGISLDHEQNQLSDVCILMIAVALLLIVASLPVAWILVDGIVRPVRLLVDATRAVVEGSDNITLPTNRTDQLGELARAFDIMGQQVRQQRQVLASTNRMLANANAQLEQANRSLEEKVAQRTSQLETANGRLSREIAEKEDFLRAVSHDLSAPLRNIAGMATMLLLKHRDTLNADIIHRLERIQKNVEVETDLISELLELSRIKTQRQATARVDIAALVEEIGGTLEEDLRSRNISLLIDTPLPALCAEKARIRQVFQNLIDNAIKYMGVGSLREIHIGCTVHTDEVEFYVQDTGIGIDPADQPKVFNVFRRGKSAAVQNVPGKGVGLASVKSIIETYQGTIWLDGALNQGTTFHFTFNGQHVWTPESIEKSTIDDDEELAAQRHAA